MNEGSVTEMRASAQQGPSPVPAASQKRRHSDYIDREIVCKILEGDPTGAVNRIKIRMFNDSVSRSKRVMEESPSRDQPLQIDSKKPRLMPFYCSTPCQLQKRSSADSGCFPGSSGSLDQTEQDAVPLHSQVFYEASKQEGRVMDNELDDSLLEPSDNEGDSPCHLTEEEISVLLDDGLAAAALEKRTVEMYSCEYSFWHDGNRAPESSRSKLSPSCHISQSGSESVGEWAESVSQSSPSGAPGHLDVVEERESERERELVLEGDLKCSPVVPLPFDFDIDELLALSPIDRSSLEHEREDFPLYERELCLFQSKPLKKEACVRNEEAVSPKPKVERPMPPPASAQEQLCIGQPVSNEASHKGRCLDVAKTSAPSQRSPPSSLLPSCTVDPLPLSGKDPASKENLASFLIELKKALHAPAPVLPSPAVSPPASKNMGSKSTVLTERAVTNTSNAALAPRAQKGNKVVLSKDSKKSTPPVKKLGKVVPVPQMEKRLVTIPPAELEQKKQTYLQCVFKHVKSPQDPNQDAYNELISLMDQVASVEYRNQERSWQHPSDLTTRNYPRFAKKPSSKYSLKQWVSQNGGHHRRFHHLSDRFHRSPVVFSSR